MIYILKRDGITQEFNKNKIIQAVLKAFIAVDGATSDYALEKANNIADYIYNFALQEYPRILDIEEIQSLVENGLSSTKRKDIAKAYILYREERNKEREKTSKIVKAVERRNNASQVENSNANVDERSFSGREKEASADIQKIIALDYVLSKEVSDAHKNMLLYQHDLEKTNIGQHNCFGRETKFVTIDGVKSFYDFEDGDNVIVMNKNGEYEPAIVHNYGPQDLKLYILQNGGYNNYHYIRATENHTWFLQDGSTTTSLKIGDKILKTPKIFSCFNADNYTAEELMLWCKGFACGDGTVEYDKSKVDGHTYKSNRTRIRLCGEKDLKWLSVFEKAGCSIRQQIANNGDRFIGVLNYHKEIPEFQNLKEVYLFFCGLYAADGTYTCKSCTGKMMYSIQSSNPEVINFIRRYADSIGLFITQERELTGKQTNFGIRPYTINFSFNPDFYYSFKVKNIEEDSYEDVWCLETQTTHSFMLAGGIPTGNCLNVDFEKLFKDGFSTRNGDIRPPATFSTACQLVAVIFQCQSQVMFGGAGCVHLDKDLAPFVKKSFIKHFKQYFEDVLDYTLEESNKEIDKIIKKYKSIELDNTKLEKDYEKAFSFAKKQLEREGKQSTEALFHNLNSLESRAGSQVPFSSINLGRDTSTEGKLVQRWIFEASLNGIGKHHLTPIFPISIYQYKSGVNAEPGTPGYEMKQLALKSLSKRIYPNFVNCDWSQAYEDLNDPDTFYSTMGKCKLQLM